MTKLRNERRETQISSSTFDDLHYEDIPDDSRKRSERLEGRRWHLLQQAMKDREILDFGREV